MSQGQARLFAFVVGMCRNREGILFLYKGVQPNLSDLGEN